MKNLDQMDLSELKILHYDVLRLVEQGQIQLRTINEQIMKKENELNTLKNPEPEEKIGLECAPEKKK